MMGIETNRGVNQQAMRVADESLEDRHGSLRAARVSAKLQASMEHGYSRAQFSTDACLSHAAIYGDSARSRTNDTA
jgi:hypothetical protein